MPRLRITAQYLVQKISRRDPSQGDDSNPQSQDFPLKSSDSRMKIGRVHFKVLWLRLLVHRPGWDW